MIKETRKSDLFNLNNSFNPKNRLDREDLE